MPDEATRKRLRDMKQKIDHIERLARELRSLGQSVPVVEQNVLTLLSTVYVLKFGISDVAEINE